MLEKLKTILREEEVPFFRDEELDFFLEMFDNSLELTAYHCLTIKAEECSLSISGLSLADSSAYWLRLAQLYRPSCTRVV